MPIDPSISLGYKGMDMPNPLNQMAQVSQIQASQRQGEAAQMQLDEMKRDRDEMVKFQQELAAKGGSTDMRQYADMLLKSRNAAHQKMGIELRQKIDSQSRLAKIMGLPDLTAPAAPAASAAPGMAAPSGALGSGTFGITPEPTRPAPVNALAPVGAVPTSSMNALAPTAAPVNDMQSRIDAAYQEGTPAALAWAKSKEEQMKPVVTGAGSSIWNPQQQRFVGTAPERTDTELMKNYNAAKVQGFNGSIFDYQQRIAQAGRAPAQPRPEQPPVAVVDPATGKQVLVSREEALRGRMTPAASMEGLSPKEIQKREAAFPVAKQAVTTISSTMNEMEATIARLLANKEGLNGITGLVGGNIPALTDKARKAQADLNQLKNLAFVQGLTELRSASASGAGVGNVTNKEGDRFENLKTSLERSQSFDDLSDSLKRLKAQTSATRNAVSQAFEDTYSYRTNTPTAAPATGGNVVVTPDGQSHTFPTPAAAAQFKKAAGIQ